MFFQAQPDRLADTKDRGLACPDSGQVICTTQHHDTGLANDPPLALAVYDNRSHLSVTV